MNAQILHIKVEGDDATIAQAIRTFASVYQTNERAPLPAAQDGGAQRPAAEAQPAAIAQSLTTSPVAQLPEPAPMSSPNDRGPAQPDLRSASTLPLLAASADVAKATPAEREEYYDLLLRFRERCADREENFMTGIRRAIAAELGEPPTQPPVSTVRGGRKPQKRTRSPAAIAKMRATLAAKKAASPAPSAAPAKPSLAAVASNGERRRSDSPLWLAEAGNHRSTTSSGRRRNSASTTRSPATSTSATRGTGRWPMPKTTDAADRRSGDGYSYGTTSITRIGGARDALRQAHRAKNRGEGNGWASVGGAGPGRKPGRPLIEFREMRRDQIRLKPDTVTAAYDAVGAKRLKWRKRTAADTCGEQRDCGGDRPAAGALPTAGDLGEAKPRCRGDLLPINPNVIGGAAPISHAELPSPRDLRELGLVSLPPFDPGTDTDRRGRIGRPLLDAILEQEADVA